MGYACVGCDQIKGIATPRPLALKGGCASRRSSSSEMQGSREGWAGSRGAEPSSNSMRCSNAQPMPDGGSRSLSRFGHGQESARNDLQCKVSSGLTQNFLQAQTSAIAVNGGAPIDVSGSYSVPTPVASNWLTALMYPTGITLAPRDRA
jgi:hypothetical protein